LVFFGKLGVTDGMVREWQQQQQGAMPEREAEGGGSEGAGEQPPFLPLSARTVASSVVRR
jgi:hypothetical protein